jgi:hypothetical protein
MSDKPQVSFDVAARVSAGHIDDSFALQEAI